MLLRLLVFFLLLAVTTPRAGVKIVVLGIAQDGGIPHIGCQQTICRTQHHFVSSLAILVRDSVYLIDATPDLRQQYAALLQRYPSYAKKDLFDGIFLTHAHMGHYSGLVFLGKESISTHKVPVYCSNEMSYYLGRNGPWSLLVENGNVELLPFQSGRELKFADLTVTPLAVPHRKEFSDTHGFLIRGSSKAMLYIPDIDSWEPVRDSMIQWLKQSNYALLDGTFYSGDELPGRNMKLVPHPTIQNSIRFLQALPPLSCRVFFTHLNHTNPLLDRSSAESKAFSKTDYSVAVDWQEFKL